MASGAPAHEVAEPTAQGGHTQSNRVHLQSLRTALSVGEDVFREAQQKAGNLPKLADVGRGPATLSEAINVREAKEEEKRRRELAKKDIKVKGKQVTPLPATSATPANEQPGLNIGNPSEAAAFWMYTEVRCSLHRRKLLQMLDVDRLRCRTTSATSRKKTSWRCFQSRPTPRTTTPSRCRSLGVTPEAPTGMRGRAAGSQAAKTTTLERSVGHFAN